ncbi:MAG TPA: hypothetical protein VEA41_22635 [Salinarimonas sp.]|nr:hypothetical protein [Salinarimonas sp.]
MKRPFGYGDLIWEMFDSPYLIIFHAYTDPKGQDKVSVRIATASEDAYYPIAQYDGDDRDRAIGFALEVQAASDQISEIFEAWTSGETIDVKAEVYAIVGEP